MTLQPIFQQIMARSLKSKQQFQALMSVASTAETQLDALCMLGQLKTQIAHSWEILVMMLLVLRIINTLLLINAWLAQLERHVWKQMTVYSPNISIQLSTEDWLFSTWAKQRNSALSNAPVTIVADQCSTTLVMDHAGWKVITELTVNQW